MTSKQTILYIYIYYRVIINLLPNEKAWCILWFWRTEGTAPPSLFNFITHNINHVSCLACLRLRTLAITTTLARVLAYQHSQVLHLYANQLTGR
jgi:hypothetical protein